jgi:hypothetical protein
VKKFMRTKKKQRSVVNEDRKGNQGTDE